MNEVFAKIAAARASMKSDNFRDGKGVALVEELIVGKFFGGNTFVARTKIVKSESKGDLDPTTKQPVTPNAPGSSVGWPQMLDKHASALGNVKAFTLNLLGFKEAEVTSDQFGEALERLISKEQPARGMLIGYETYQQATRSGANAGKINTYVRWVHVPPSAGNSPEEILKRRAELDKIAPLAR
jgi:hypothetical protein